MQTIRPADRRSEARAEADLGLLVWALNIKGERFLQEARARDVSRSGALLTGLNADVLPGDVVGILYAGIEARFRVIWTCADKNGGLRAAVHRIESEKCPWLDFLAGATSIPLPAICSIATSRA
jgi:hypothetical protein